MKKFEMNATFLTQISLTILIFNILVLTIFSPLIFKFLTKTETPTISETLNQTSTIETQTLNQTSITETQTESSPNPQTFTTTETSNETANSTHF